MDRKPRRITTAERTVMSEKGANIGGFGFAGPYMRQELQDRPGVFAIGYVSPLGSRQWLLVDVRTAESVLAKVDQEAAAESELWQCWRTSCKGEESRISFLVCYLDSPMPELQQMAATILSRYVTLPCSQRG